MNQNDIQEWLQKNAHHYYYGIQNDPRLIQKINSEADILFERSISLLDEAKKNHKKAQKNYIISIVILSITLVIICNIIIFGV